jgi:hypothetical protein
LTTFPTLYNRWQLTAPLQLVNDHRLNLRIAGGSGWEHRYLAWPKRLLDLCLCHFA